MVWPSLLKILINMIKHTFSILLIFCICIAKPAKSQLVFDQLQTISQDQLELEGFIGGKTDLIIENRVKAEDYDYLVEPFRHKTETHLWQSEFWGKWMLGAVASWEYTHDPEWMAMMDQAVNKWNRSARYRVWLPEPLDVRLNTKKK